MLALDLFNTPFERALNEGAVDDLEARRIHHLNTRMLELMSRANDADFKASPEGLAGLKREYQKLKDERDSYYKIREAGIPGNVPTEKIPGKEDLLKGRGRTYYEDEVNEDDVEDFIKAGGKITYGKPQKGPRRPGMSLASRHIGGGNDRMKPSRSGRAANTQGKPVVSVEDSEKKNSETGPLDQKLQRLKVQARRQFPRAQSDDEALVLKLLDKETQDDQANRRTDARQDAELRKNFALDREQEDEIDNLQAQVGVKEHGGGIGPRQRWQDLMPEQTNPEDYDDYEDEDEDLRLRSGDYVRDQQDGEYGEVFRMQGDPYERRVRILDRDGKGWYIEPGRLVAVDRNDPDIQRYFGKQRVRDMDEMDKSQPSQERHGDRALGAKGTAATPVAARKVVKDLAMDLDQAFAKQKPVKKKGVAEGWFFNSPEEKAKKAEQRRLKYEKLKKDVSEDLLMVIDKQIPELIEDINLNQFENAGAIWFAIRNKVFNAILGDIIPGDSTLKQVSDKITEKLKVFGSVPDLFTLDNAKNYKLKFNQQMIIDKEYIIKLLNQYLILLKKGLDNTKQGVAEGWSDAAVARRTGGARTPYSVYIKGKKWKDFESDDHAEAVANKLRAKFKADGRDPSVITVAPTDYDQPIKEEQDSSGVERAILNRIMVAHTDLLMKFGPDKVMQAAEEVAYNVGDVDEIGTSDVSAYVAQVKQILGAAP
jgi:hypothetical protein